MERPSHHRSQGGHTIFTTKINDKIEAHKHSNVSATRSSTTYSPC